MGTSPLDRTLEPAGVRPGSYERHCSEDCRPAQRQLRQRHTRVSARLCRREIRVCEPPSQCGGLWAGQLASLLCIKPSAPPLLPSLPPPLLPSSPPPLLLPSLLPSSQPASASPTQSEGSEEAAVRNHQTGGGLLHCGPAAGGGVPGQVSAVLRQGGPSM